LERAPSTDEFLVEFSCDPGAYLILETTTNLTANSWQPVGLVVTESSANAVLSNAEENMLFWRLRRQIEDGQ
jgi:hypothetical protein